MRIDAVTIAIFTLYCLYLLGCTKWWKRCEAQLSPKNYNAIVFFATVTIAILWILAYKLLTILCSSFF